MKSRSIVDKVPRELQEVAKFVKLTNGKKTRQDAYRDIASVARLLWGNKKGQIMDLIAISFLALVFVIFISVVVFGTKTLNDKIQASDIEAASVKTQMQQETNSLHGWLDFGFVFLFFMILLALLAINFFLQTNIIFIMIYVPSVLFMGAIFIAFNNGLNILKDKFPAAFAQLPMTSFVINNFYTIMIMFYILFFILLFAKPRGEGIGG